MNFLGNSLNAKCGDILFSSLKDHKTLQEISIANNEKLHKNRIGPKGCLQLKNMLMNNRILTMLNLTGNSIGAEGLKYIIDGLIGNKTMLSLNLSDNGLPASCIYSLIPSLIESGVKEL